MEWIKICNITELNEDEPKSVKFNDSDVGIYEVEGEYFALENNCPHAYA